MTRDELEKELHRLEDSDCMEQWIVRHCCPLCLKIRPVRTCSKGANKGRLYMSCQECDVFEWHTGIDKQPLPRCKSCNRLTYEAIAKTDKNNGRAFASCPKQCFFRWLDN